MEEYLKSDEFHDFEDASIKNFINEIEFDTNETEQELAIKIYYHVRDKIIYDPYHIILTKDAIKPSSVIKRGYGYCVEKALLLTACLRALKIPARIGFANVKNHLNSKRLSELMKTDIFVFHGYTEIFLNEKWVKCTPAFNKKLCEKAGIYPLEFDAVNDSMFHKFDKSGNQHMEYLHDYGTFAELPFEKMITEYDKYYPHLKVIETKSFGVQKANFHDEVGTFSSLNKNSNSK